MFYSLTPTTPINVDRLELELCKHPDRAYVSYLWSGLHNGFDTMIANAHITNLECKSLMSARKNPSDIQELIEIECKNGFLYGPFSKPPFNEYRVSPLGLAIENILGRKDSLLICPLHIVTLIMLALMN